MVTIALCDDDQEQLAALRQATEQFISRLPPEHQPGGGVTIRAFSSALACLDDMEANGTPDIALLDICMPHFSGMQLAQAIRAKNAGTQIIFLTSSREYAMDAFAVQATHYLVKPFTQEQFDQAMNRTLFLFKNASKHITIHGMGESFTLVDISEINYIESIGHRRYVHTTKGEFTETRRTLTQFMEELERLSPGTFICPYRGYIVNLATVRTLSSKNMQLKDGATILIKPGDFRALKEKLFSYMFAQDEPTLQTGLPASQSHR